MYLDLTLSISMDDPFVSLANMDQASLMSVGHIGTHLDTYLQTAIPPEFCVRPGKVFDLRPLAGRDADLSVLGDQTVDKGDFVIFCTGQLARYGYSTREYFTGSEFSQLSWELADHLISRQVSFIGVDAGGARQGDDHQILDHRAEDNGVYIIENIANVPRLVDEAAGHGFRVITGWTGLRGFSGLSCRVVAEFESDA
jgi:kynurenine formamidase